MKSPGYFLTASGNIVTKSFISKSKTSLEYLLSTSTVLSPRLLLSKSSQNSGEKKEPWVEDSLYGLDSLAHVDYPLILAL